MLGDISETQARDPLRVLTKRSWLQTPPFPNVVVQLDAALESHDNSSSRYTGECILDDSS